MGSHPVQVNFILILSLHLEPVFHILSLYLHFLYLFGYESLHVVAHKFIDKITIGLYSSKAQQRVLDKDRGKPPPGVLLFLPLKYTGQWDKNDHFV